LFVVATPSVLADAVEVAESIWKVDPQNISRRSTSCRAFADARSINGTNLEAAAFSQ